ncbi:hypothetical protein GCM10028813_43980 [Ramlibacter alkalitolerans]
MARSKQQELVDAAFEARAAAHPELRKAVLVRRKDEDSGDTPLLTHRIYRTSEGSYFLFICEAGQRGYLTQLTRERAQNALRSTPEIFRQEFGRDP